MCINLKLYPCHILNIQLMVLAVCPASDKTSINNINYLDTFTCSSLLIKSFFFLKTMISLFSPLLCCSSYHIEQSQCKCGDVIFAMFVVHDLIHHHQCFYDPLLVFCDGPLVLFPQRLWILLTLRQSFFWHFEIVICVNKGCAPLAWN